MKPKLLRCLRVLQQTAYAKLLLEYRNTWDTGFPELLDSRRAVAEAEERLAAREAEFTLLLAELSGAERSNLKIARALFLRTLLESAPARLQCWEDRSPLAQMPRSELLEWLSHDLERMELEHMERAMTPEEAAIYVQSFDATEG